MLLDEFLEKQNVKIDQKIHDLCLRGYEEMKNGRDGMHDEFHARTLIIDPVL